MVEKQMLTLEKIPLEKNVFILTATQYDMSQLNLCGPMQFQ